MQARQRAEQPQRALGSRSVIDQAIGIIQAALQGYGLERADLIHAIRMLRIACHGISSLEAEGAFGLPESLDVTFDRLVNALDAEFRHS